MGDPTKKMATKVCNINTLATSRVQKFRYNAPVKDRESVAEVFYDNVL